MSAPFLRRLALGLAVAGLVSVAHAANHPVTRLLSDSNSTPKVDTFDIVVSTDLDYREAPTIPGMINSEPATVTFNQDYITRVLRQTACTLYSSTEGRQRIGKAFIYPKGLYDKNVDIQIIAGTAGRSNASAPGWMSKDATTTNYLITQAGAEPSQQVLESEKNFGLVIVHELMHYLYGMHDEYQEAGKAVDPNDPGAPAESDVPVDSVMHDQTSVQTLSTDGDYAAKNSDFTKTAHGRVFGTSVWGALVRAASEDTGKAAELQRTRFPAFEGMAVPASRQELTEPGKDCAENGPATAAFVPVFVTDPKTRAYIAVSLALEGEQLDAAKAAAIKVVEALTVGPNTTVVVAALGQNTTVGTPIVLGDSTAVEAAKSAINALASESTTNTLSEQLDPVRTDIAAAYGNGIAEGDAVVLNLFAASGSTLTAALATQLKDLRVALNAGESSFNSQGQAQPRQARSARSATAVPTTLSLADVAAANGGEYVSARNAAELGTKIAAAASEGDGDGEELLGYEETETLAANGSLSMSVPVQPTFDTELSFTASWSEDDDAAKLSFTLRDPSGVEFNPEPGPGEQELAEGIGYEFDADAQEATFTVADDYEDRGGTWTLTVTAASAVGDPVVLSASADSALTTEAEIVDDLGPEPTLRVKVAGERPLLGATVTAQIIRSSDGQVVKTFTALDNGRTGDVRRNDGVYSVRLAGLAAGEYDVEVDIEDTNGTATLSSAGVNARGNNVADVPVTGDFKRSNSTIVGIQPAVGTIAPGGASASVDSLSGAVQISTSQGQFTSVVQPSRPAGAPADGLYPVGFYDFTISNVTPGGTVAVTFTLPAGTNPNAYLKCSAGGASCAVFPAVIVGNTVTLSLVDGGSGDADGLANGTIVDPGAPAVLPAGPADRGGFFGLGSLGAGILLALAGAGLARRRIART